MRRFRTFDHLRHLSWVCHFWPLMIAASSSSDRSTAVRFGLNGEFRSRSAAFSSACWLKENSRRIDGSCPTRDLFSNCFTTPSDFVMTLRFPFSLTISFESSSRSNFDPKSDGFFGRPEPFPRPSQAWFWPKTNISTGTEIPSQSPCTFTQLSRRSGFLKFVGILETAHALFFFQDAFGVFSGGGWSLPRFSARVIQHLVNSRSRAINHSLQSCFLFFRDHSLTSRRAFSNFFSESL